MGKPKALVIYYSRTGTTRQLADAISTALAGDIEEVVDTRNRRGIFGYLRAGFDAATQRLTTLKPTRYNPADYDLIVVGTPIWNGSLTPPVRTYLAMHKGQLRNVAFFCTSRASGARHAFKQMTEACGLEPLGRLDVKEAEVKRGELQPRVQSFVATLTSAKAAA